MKLDYAGTQTQSPVQDHSQPGLSSFILSLFFFVPFVTGFMAVMLGGLALNGRGGTRDRALGLAGLIIGSVCLVGWTLLLVISLTARL